MRIEAFAGPARWDELTAAARAAEAAGFDAFTTPEIHGDPFQALAIAGAATERIELRTAIAVAFPRSPMITAYSAWDLHEQSGGRFGLGLGTQVKGHNERRFSVPWPSAPARKLQEYVESLRAIFRCWQRGERLSYEGEHYRFSLMTPEFANRPSAHAPIPIHTAAVRPAMMRLAGRVADGVRLHGFCTRRYLEEVALPSLREGLAQSGRPRERFEICGGGFVVTGPDEAALAEGLEWVRYRVAFYGSTRTYSPVMSLHGWDDLAGELHEMSKTGRWKEMAARVPDDVAREFAAVGTYDELPAAVARRFGGLTDAVELALRPGDDERVPALLAELRALPTSFERFPTWDELP